MEEFNKRAAMRGARVCTREGWPVRILCFDCRMKRKGGISCPIVAEVFFKDADFKNGNWAVAEYDLNGKYRGEDNLPHYNLMMADDDYLEKLDRGEYDHIEDNLEMVGKPDHIGESAEKVHDPRSLGNEWLNDMIKARSSIFKDLERSLDIERRKYELSKLKHEADMLKLERITENWDYWRCMYAGMAMQGTLARFRLYPDCTCTDNSVYDMAAAESVKYADSLIEELKKKK